MSLLVSLRPEILKTKRTASFYLAIAAGMFSPFMSLLDMLIDEGISPDDAKVILSKMFIEKFQITSFVVFPVFLMLICTLLPQIEYRNNTWKQVLTSPQSKASIFAAKFINIHLLVLVFLLTNHAFMFIDAVILHFMRPSLNILNQPIDGYRVLATIANSYGALLALCAIQFWLGLRFRNFIVPIAIGMACWFAGSILAMQFQPGVGIYFPYSFHAYGTFPQFKTQLAGVHWASLGYAVLFLILGFLDFSTKRMHA